MVLGIDYKSMLKPQIKAVAKNAKQLYADKIKEKNAVEKQLQENAALLDVKTKELTAIQRQSEQVCFTSLFYTSTATTCFFFYNLFV